jgi:O-antigen ligase
MKAIKTSKNKIKKAAIQSFIILLFLNTLYTLFFFSKTYEQISIETSLKSNVPTEAWYVYKNKNSDERYFSDRISLTPDSSNNFKYTINSNKELDYIGLFWMSEKGSSLEVTSYSQKVDSKTYFSKKNREIIDYTNKGCSIVDLDSGGVRVTSSKSNRNWIMLNNTGFINDKRDIKTHHPIPLKANFFLLVVLLFTMLWHKPLANSFNNNIVKVSNLKTFIFCLWAFIIPFWVIFSHTLMGLLVLLTLYETIKQKRWEAFFISIKKSAVFFVFFFWLILATAITSTNHQFFDVLLDSSYFLFMPIAFVFVEQKTLNKILSYFEIGIFTYFLLLLIFLISTLIKDQPQVSFIEFIVTTIELFWHTSYLSALLLIVFIKYIEKPIGANLALLGFYLVSLLFMYIVNARLPFVIGALILLFKCGNGLKNKGLRISFFSASVIGSLIVLGFFLLNKPNSENNNTIESIQSLDARLSLWEASIKQIKLNPVFGVGSKNTIDSIANELITNTDTKFRDYNVHNQFIEVFLSYGLIGFVLFITLFFKMFKKPSIYSKAFILTCSILFFVESYLQRQAGIVFFTFWYSFFLIYKPSNHANKY